MSTDGNNSNKIVTLPSLEYFWYEKIKPMVQSKNEYELATITDMENADSYDDLDVNGGQDSNQKIVTPAMARYAAELFGGGGDADISAPTISVPEEYETSSIVVEKGDVLNIPVTFLTPNKGKGTLVWTLKNATTSAVIDTSSVSILGTQSIQISIENSGSYILSMYAYDRTYGHGGLESNVIDIRVLYGALSITSTFRNNSSYELPAVDSSTQIQVPVNISCLVPDPGNGQKISVSCSILRAGTVEPAVLTDELDYTTTVNHVFYPTISPTGGDMDRSGVYKLNISAKIAKDADGTEYYISNTLTYNILIEDGESLLITSDYAGNVVDATQYDNLNISYTISMKNQTKFSIVCLIDNEQALTANVYVGTNMWNINTDNLAVGLHSLKIIVTTTDESIEPITETLSLTLNLKESSFQKIFPVDDSSLVARYNFVGLNNTDETRETLVNVKNPGTYDGTLHGFNFISNGYDGEKLICNGAAYVVIPYPVFSSNCVYGCTVDICFRTRDIGDTAAKVIECANYVSLANGIKLVGLSIDTLKASFGSLTQELSANILNDEDIRVTFVIDRETSKFFIYINGEISHMLQLSDQITGSIVTSTYESFEHPNYIVLNGQFTGSTNASTVGSHGSSEYKDILIYNRPLTYSEVVNNYISGLNLIEQQKEYNKNYNNDISTMYFKYKKSQEDYLHASKSNKIPCDVRFLSKSASHGSSFELYGCQLKMQGTSSLQYPVKNYDITLYKNGEKTSWLIRPGAIPETKFCLKADYMSPNHANNTGLARFLNDGYLKITGSDGEPLLSPAQKYVGSEYRTAIDGYPIQLYKELTDDDGNVIETKWVGVYNLNNSKDNTTTFGMINDSKITQGQGYECKPVSFEVTANSNVSAGAFVKFADSPANDGTISELDYYKTDFELSYPDEDDLTSDEIESYYRRLIKVIEFVNDADDETFKSEISNYFNLDFLLYYYCATIALGLVDNFGKNMMLRSWGGTVFYPTFYDVDTALRVTNSGEPKFDVDIEMDSENTFNTSNSNLWVKLARCFPDKIREMYIKMREAFLNLNTFKKYYYSDQIDTIGAILYNMDAECKYFDFPAYYSICRGSAWTETLRWFTERILFCDTLMEYDAQVGKSITVRVNMDTLADGSIAPVKFSLKTYSPMYVKIKFTNNANGTIVRKIGRDEVVEISGTVNTTTDQEVIIYNAEFIKDIGDLTDKKISRILLENAPRLTKLVCHNSPYLSEVSILSNNQFLQELDLQGCSRIAGQLSVSSLVNLKKVNIYGTSITNLLTNSEGGNLEEIYYPYSIISLNLLNQYNLVKAIVPINIDSGQKADIISVNLFNNPMLELVCEFSGLTSISTASSISIIDCPKLTENIVYNINTSPIEYGIRWFSNPLQSSPKCERVMIIHGNDGNGNLTKEFIKYGNETQLIANVGTNTETAFNSFDNISPWKDIKDVIVQGRQMVSIPVNWYIKREETDEGYCYLMITVDKAVALLKGYHSPRKFLNKDKSALVNAFYVGKYKTSGEYGNQCVSGAIPTTNKARSWFRDAARNIGSGWHTTDMQYLYEVLAPLFYIEFATFFDQSIMRGHVFGRYKTKYLLTISNSYIHYVESSFITPPEGYWWFNSDMQRIIAYEKIAVYADSSGNYNEDNVIRLSDVVSDVTNYQGNTENERFYNYMLETYGSTSFPPKIGYKITFDYSLSSTAGESFVYDAPSITGSTDNVLTPSGSTISNTDGTSDFKYRGIENIYGDIWEFVDGINVNNHVNYTCEDIDLYYDDVWTVEPSANITGSYSTYTELTSAMNVGELTANNYYLVTGTNTYYLYNGTTCTSKGTYKRGGYYEVTGYTNSTSDGHVRQMGYDENFPWVRVPKTVGGSNKTYMTTGYLQDTGKKMVRVGGHWLNGDDCGLVYLTCRREFTYRAYYVGSRLLLVN